MGTIEKVRALGLGYVLETLFERFVPAWVFRISSVAVYQLDFDKFADSRLSTATVKICDSEKELEQLQEITCDDTPQKNTIGVLATAQSEVTGGLWLATGDYRDHDLGLLLLLGENNEDAWIYSARVAAEYRRQGIYSHLMATTVQSRKAEGNSAPFIGVSELNKGSRNAIKRFANPVGKVLIIRIGSLAWARSTGDLKQRQRWTASCTKRPIQITMK